MTSGPGMGPYRPRVELAIYMRYDPQPIRDRRVGGDGDYFHTVRKGINPGDIRVRSRVVGVVHVCVDGL